MAISDVINRIKEKYNTVEKNVGSKGATELAEIVCNSTSDYYTVQFFNFIFFSANAYNSNKHLEYYMKGSGLPLKVDLAKVLRDDNKLKLKVFQEIRDTLNSRGFITYKNSFAIQITQQDYSGLSDWRYAIGGMYIKWQPIGGGKIKCWFENKYQWHPDRIGTTQCIHQAAVNLQKTISARDYMMYGETIIDIRDL